MKHPIIKRDRRELEKRRVAASKLFEQGVSQAAVAKEYKVTPAAVCKWYAAWSKKGHRGLVSKGPPGTTPALSATQKEKLKHLLLRGSLKAGYATNFWTLARIQEVSRQKLKVRMGTGTVWRTVVALGFSCQKPEKQARERNEKAITDWKLKEFPRLKKMGSKAPLSVGVPR
ncbi:transposase [Candidatus Falkowbacteria bacterium]|nr:transposase [Candidatus Falkowbacteria bacterium]